MGCIWGLFALVILAVIGNMVSSFQEGAERQRKADAEAAAARAERQLAADLALLLEDSAEIVLAEARTLLREGDAAAAQARMSQFSAATSPQDFVKSRDSINFEARRLLRDAQVQAVLDTLRGVPASEVDENVRLYRKLVQLRPINEYKSRLAVYEERQTAQVRRNYAKALETQFLRDGRDVVVTTAGPNATTLRLEWVLFSRVTVQQMEDDGTLLQEAKDMGFKRVELRDGYDFGVVWTIN